MTELESPAIASGPSMPGIHLAGKPVAGLAATSPAAITVPALTSMRFFAAFWVVIYQSGGPFLVEKGLVPWPVANLIRNGYLGVTFFFVLSGSILTQVYCSTVWRVAETRNYVIARIARIYPVYLLSLALLLPFYGLPDTARELLQFALLQSFMPPVFVNPIADQALNWNMQAWTLSVELFFYLSFPFTVVSLDKLGTVALRSVAIALVAVMCLTALPQISDVRTVTFGWLAYLPLPVLRWPEFLYGVVLSLLVARGSLWQGGRATLLALAALLMTLAATTNPFVAGFVAGIVGILIAGVAILTPKGIPMNLLAARPLVLLGGASYALYVLQGPVHALLIHGFTAVGLSEPKAIYHCTLLAASVVVFLLWEEPARRFLRRLLFSPARIVASAF